MMWKDGWTTREEAQDMIKDVKNASEVCTYLRRRMNEECDYKKNRSIVIETAELLHKFPEMMQTNGGFALHDKVLSKLEEFPEFEEYTNMLTMDVANIDFIAKLTDLQAYAIDNNIAIV